MKKKLEIIRSNSIFTPEEMKYLDNFNWNVSVLEIEKQREILQIYNRALGTNQSMTQCTPCWQGIMAILKSKYDEVK